jgi:hypothetical protein
MTSNRLPILADEIRKAHAEVGVAMLTAAERSIAAGHLLMEAKELAGHGEWLPYLKALGIPPRTAQRYMTLAASGFKSATVAYLGIRRAERFIAMIDQCWELHAELSQLGESLSPRVVTKALAEYYTDRFGIYLITVAQTAQMISHRDDCQELFFAAVFAYAENSCGDAFEATVKTLFPPELMAEAA